MAGKPKLDPKKTQAEEIAQLKDDYLASYAALPVQQLAADCIGRSPDTIQDWMKSDSEFAARCSRAKAEWAQKRAGSRRVREDWLLERVLKEECSPRQELTGTDGGARELGIAGIVREAAQNAQQPPSDTSQHERGDASR